MRQSSTARRATAWMDRERAFDMQIQPRKVRAEVDPLARLTLLRREIRDHRLEVLRKASRMPRVCRYLLHEPGQPSEHFWEESHAFACMRGWRVTRRTFTDNDGASAPSGRAGWTEVRRLIRAGYADGVVVTRYSAISPCVEEYEEQLDLIDQHLGFIALMRPEVTEVR